MQLHCRKLCSLTALVNSSNRYKPGHSRIGLERSQNRTDTNCAGALHDLPRPVQPPHSSRRICEMTAHVVAASPALSTIITDFLPLIMVALCNRADHYIILLSGFYLSSFVFFPSPNLSGRTLLVYHTSKHGVALVRN